MADNTILNQPTTTGDTIRSVAKTATSAKAQVTIIDVGGGADASPEVALTVGQATKAASLPVTLASDQGAISVSLAAGSNAVGTVNTLASNPSSLYVAQFTPGISAAQFPFQALVNGVVVKALSSNTATIFIGSSSAVTDQIGATPGYPLAAGEACSIAVTNLNAMWAIGDNTTDTVAIIGN